MGELSNQAKRIRQLKAVLIAAAKEVEKYAKKEWKEEYKKGQKEFGDYQKEKIKDAFDDAVTSWYGGYEDVKYYKRQANLGKKEGGVFSVLQLMPDNNGMFDDEHPELFYSGSMHAGRDGYSDLYDKVFVNGYHGGAEKGKGHPNPPTPYYRTGPNLIRWGVPAVCSTPAKELFEKELSKLRTDDFEVTFNEIMDKHHDITQEKIDKYVASIKRKIFGV